MQVCPFLYSQEQKFNVKSIASPLSIYSSLCSRKIVTNSFHTSGIHSAEFTSQKSSFPSLDFLAISPIMIICCCCKAFLCVEEIEVTGISIFIFSSARSFSHSTTFCQQYSLQHSLKRTINLIKVL